MNTYCVKCRKDTKYWPKNRTKNNRLVMQSKCSVCWIKKSRFIKEQEAKGLLSNLGIKTPSSKIPLLNVLFWMNVNMSGIISKFLLVGDKFMPAMLLKQPGFTYSACGQFTKNKELKNLCKLEIQILFIKMNLIKLVFNMIWLMENQKI